MPEISNFPKVDFFLSFSKIILRIFQKSTKHDSEKKMIFLEIFYGFFFGHIAESNWRRGGKSSTFFWKNT